MKHVCVYTEARASNYDLYPVFVVESCNDEDNLKQAVLNVASEMIQVFELDLALTEFLLDLSFFQVDSRVVPVIEPLLPDLCDWEKILSDGGIRMYSLYGVFDVLKAFKIDNEYRYFTEEEVQRFTDTINCKYTNPLQSGD